MGSKTGLLLMNMGGPKDTTRVGPFLKNLFTDPDIISLGRFQNIVGTLISKRRTPRIISQYNQIGGGSPILKWTNVQGQKLCNMLEQRFAANETSFKHYVAFRYVEPTTREALLQMKKEGVKRVIAFSQYPQYSCTTTGSSLNELHKQLKELKFENEFEWSVIDRWFNHKGHAKAIAKLIQDCLSTYEEPESVIILFSAHSLPISCVNRGDPYPLEVAITAQNVIDQLGTNHRYRVVWQSKVGPVSWLGPQTIDTLKAYVTRGHCNIVLVPIAFTCDHIETLYELDHEYIGELQKLGFTNVKRVSSLNDEPLFIEALADVVVAHLEAKKKSSSLLRMQCPSCKNPKCFTTKSFFAS